MKLPFLKASVQPVHIQLLLFMVISNTRTAIFISRGKGGILEDLQLQPLFYFMLINLTNI
uniref:Uncharacterized protein n=1 Tax=Nelumbo nucifera TaxID=4432 RepID=A0A822Z486_NELNU|nr:TPA_asm: hypothetical protein HUJ06_008437 [Nelumbo nucifera]